MHHPGMARDVRHGGEPDQPVESVVVGRDPARGLVGVVGLALPIVFHPLGVLVDRRVARSLQYDFVARATDASEETVGIHQVQAIERRVHDLVGRQEVLDRRDTQQQHCRRPESEREPLPARVRRPLSRAIGPLDPTGG